MMFPPLKPRTYDTLYLLVTCCVEETRFKVLEQVVRNLKEQQVTNNLDIEHDLLVFDNGSTYPGAVNLLRENFTHVLRSPTNEGFWSAINSVLHRIGNRYKYIYVIESDHIHFALEKVVDIEKFLGSHPDIGGVRCQEFVVADRHLYDKTNQRSDSRSYAWVKQVNTRGQRVSIEPTDVPGFYVTDFLSQLHSVNRIEPFMNVFKVLDERSRAGSRFSELDYQLLYAEQFPKFGLIDGGLFHAKLTWQSGAIAGSYCGPGAQESVGYQETRVSIITPTEKMNVESL